MMDLELNVGGMTCDGCERSIAKAIERISGVTAVRADHRSGRVVVEADRAIARAELEQAVDDAGYVVIPPGSSTLPLA